MNRRMGIINYHDIVTFFIIIFSLNLEYLRRIAVVGKLFYMFPAIIGVVYLLLICVRFKKFSEGLKLVILYWVLFFLSTMYNNKNQIIDAFFIAAPCLSIAAITEYYWRSNKDQFVISLYKALFVLLIVDLMSILLYPDGLYFNSTYPNWKYWFLGYKTERIRSVVLPLITLCAIKTIKENKCLTKGFYIVAVLSLIDAFLSGATGGSISVLFAVLCIYIIYKNQKNRFRNFIVRLFDFKFMILLLIALNIVVVFIQRLDLFSYIIVDVLGKDLTLTGRTYIWEASIQKFLLSPIIGNGYISSTDYIAITHNTAGTSPHNLILSIAVYTGILGIFLYSIMINRSLRGIKSFQINPHCICVIAIISTLVLGISSNNFYGQFNYAFFVIAQLINSSKVDKYNENE